jgi:hypothetical protein
MKCNANVGSMLENIYMKHRKTKVALTGIRRTTDLRIAGQLLYQSEFFTPFLVTN